MDGRFRSAQERRYAQVYEKFYDEKRDVFRNKLGITDQEELDRREARIVQIRSANRPKLETFDPEEIKALHAYLFVQVYAWAGQSREYPTGRSAAPFALPERIDGALEQFSKDLKKENYLQGLDKKTFAERAGHYASEFNAIHPFVEDNGRMPRILIEDLSVEAGHDFDPRLIRRDKAAW